MGKRLLLVQLDDIGDYVLFRNFIQVLRESERYRGYRITLLGKHLWRDLADSLDRVWVDDFIWIDQRLFYKGTLDNLFPLLWQYFPRKYLYRKRTLAMLRGLEFDVVLRSGRSRSCFAEEIVATVKAPVKIGCCDEDVADPLCYTKVITMPNNIRFEFHRNRFFFAQVLGSEVSLVRPEIPMVESFIGNRLMEGNYVVVAPGASHSSKRWAPRRMAVVMDAIAQFCGMPIILVGGGGDAKHAQHVAELCRHARVWNLVGSFSLNQLPTLIGGARMMISMDSGAIHIGAAVGTPAVCIARDCNSGRHMPYPSEVSVSIRAVFPPGETLNTSRNRCFDNWPLRSSRKINRVDVKTVIREVQQCWQDTVDSNSRQP